MPEKLFDTKDRHYFHLSYKRKNKLYAWDRLQWLWIKRKTARIKRHTEKMMTKRERRRKKGFMER